jgi:6-pyruvoyl tetrahydropterin synthase/QueD family protein
MTNEQNIRKVRIEGGNLRFNSAHFITYSGQCERLHGHNYVVQVEIEGVLDEDSLVFNFSTLKQCTEDICKRLHHRFLLPLHNSHLELTEAADSWEIRYQNRRYIFPRADVVGLPIDNSTAERLSEYICDELCNSLVVSRFANLYSIMVGVEERPTQIAFYSKSLRESK